MNIPYETLTHCGLFAPHSKHDYNLNEMYSIRKRKIDEFEITLLSSTSLRSLRTRRDRGEDILSD